MKKTTLSAIMFSLFSFTGFTQESCPMSIGTNLPPADEQVFKDLKLVSNDFCTRNSVYVGDDNDNDWDSGLIGVIPTDANGYPTIDIPFSHPSVLVTQTYHFLTATSGIYPTGHYILTFEGDGIINVSNWSDAENVVQVNPNQIEFDVFTTTDLGIHVEITQSNGANHVRNISIVHQDDVATYQTQPFRQEFVQLADNFSCIRFMDWMATNKLYYDEGQPYDSSTISWSNRITPTYHKQNIEDRGLAYEYVILLANQLEKDIWINIPHQADTAYITSMAQLFYNNLNSNSTVYVEFSNEVWNTIFQQTEFVNNEGPYTGEYDYGRNLGWFSDIAFGIWKDVYGAEQDRLKFVIAGHDWVCVDALSVMTNIPDVASYPGYFHLSDTHWNELEIIGASATVQDIVTRVEEDMAGGFYWMNQFKQLVCDAHNIDFVMYEGGQHLLRTFGLAETFQNALYQTQVSPEMYDLYETLLTYCRDVLDVKLFNHFTLYGPNESEWGSWGMVESIYETPNTPKYQALMDFSCEDLSTETNPEMTEGIIRVYPNPTNGIVHIQAEEEVKEIRIFSVTGQLLNTKYEQNSIDLSGYSKGTYFIRITTGNGTTVKQLMKK